MVSSAIQTKWLILGDRIHVLRMEKQVQNQYFHSLSINIYKMLIIYNLIQNSFFKTFWKAERLQKKTTGQSDYTKKIITFAPKRYINLVGSYLFKKKIAQHSKIPDDFHEITSVYSVHYMPNLFQTRSGLQSG